MVTYVYFYGTYSIDCPCAVTHIPDIFLGDIFPLNTVVFLERLEKIIQFTDALFATPFKFHYWLKAVKYNLNVSDCYILVKF
jgi:hypothetical protein